MIHYIFSYVVTTYWTHFCMTLFKYSLCNLWRLYILILLVNFCVTMIGFYNCSNSYFNDRLMYFELYDTFSPSLCHDFKLILNNIHGKQLVALTLRLLKYVRNCSRVPCMYFSRFFFDYKNSNVHIIFCLWR